ncbi:Na+/H+ antiporter subunit E [Rossellomorea marisflavi]|jgi:multicomponent Na+:H+ antiporter subunit E|uniref:Na+/H+ antiporter subunit E n=1 Tax=Rossellomorea marisflavi TaxID=189381 RepID=A0A5D4RNB6_9BACI|nr:Na+/H+ antiporter subunit E [Rossellomorea marisflavi]KQU57950.1 cation:proton antiporter [Bacillus sp. Leaf406]MDW4527858.1 Na+/H+ antiporter subunit E [Rossellomorea marisflavi]TYS52925.1 Na+/H+ antiporter subunit E [Rossellomorea marisflavi]UKS64485.1 Na+/H+ antiporter subunit E [Rossellomorea marisflavi]WJV19881.1 Na+/H+ antiporter subunit E [Rossellomorea marisflavi]
MAFQILLNFILAFVWMFLSVSFTAPSFIVGYLLGLLIILAMRRFFPDRFYLWRVVASISLLLLFLKELIKANVDVLKTVLKPKLDFQPGIFAYETNLKKDWEVTLLANLITLTPGTLVMDVSMDKKILYVHAIDLPDKDAVIDDIRNSFEKAIMEVSR